MPSRNPVAAVVLPAAGWGARFLPTTKAVPKELLPLVDKPVIQYGLEEALASGLERAVIVTSPAKNALEDYLLPSPALSRFLESRSKSHLLSDLDRLVHRLDVSFVTQAEQLGLGHAVLTAARTLDPQPFAVLLPDDVIRSRAPALRQMLDVFDARQASILAVQRIPKDRISDYGVIKAQEIAPRLHRVHALVEKPRPQDAPSDLGIVGRYVLTPAIADALAATAPGALGEIQLTDAIANLLQDEPVYALEFEGRRYDAGNPLGLIKASIAMGLAHPRLAPDLRAFLSRLPLSTD